MKQVETAIAVVLMIAAVPASAQMLKCVGKDGKVEYATQCPPGSQEQQTGIRNQPGAIKSAPPAQQKSMAEREADFRKRQTVQGRQRHVDIEYLPGRGAKQVWTFNLLPDHRGWRKVAL